MVWSERLVMAPLLAAIVFLGVYPKPVLERIEPAVDRLVAHVEQHSDFHQPVTGRIPEARGAGEHE
jgi:NADH-quinone oxidoreductase subunit M